MLNRVSDLKLWQKKRVGGYFSGNLSGRPQDRGTVFDTQGYGEILRAHKREIRSQHIGLAPGDEVCIHPSRQNQRSVV